MSIGTKVRPPRNGLVNLDLLGNVNTETVCASLTMFGQGIELDQKGLYRFTVYAKYWVCLNVARNEVELG